MKNVLELERKANELADDGCWTTTYVPHVSGLLCERRTPSFTVSPGKHITLNLSLKGWSLCILAITLALTRNI